MMILALVMSSLVAFCQGSAGASLSSVFAKLHMSLPPTVEGNKLSVLYELSIPAIHGFTRCVSSRRQGIEEWM